MCTIISDTLLASFPQVIWTYQFKWMYMWVPGILLLSASPGYLYHLSGSVKHHTLRSFFWLPYIYYVSLLMCSLSPLCYFCCRNYCRENGISGNLYSVLPLAISLPLLNPANKCCQAHAHPKQKTGRLISAQINNQAKKKRPRDWLNDWKSLNEMAQRDNPMVISPIHARKISNSQMKMMGQRPGEFPAQSFLLSSSSGAMNRVNSLTVITDKILSTVNQGRSPRF